MIESVLLFLAYMNEYMKVHVKRHPSEIWTMVGYANNEKIAWDVQRINVREMQANKKQKQSWTR